jgi:hypothetical protein
MDLNTPSVLTDVWGMSSAFVQVTVVPTGTVIVCGPKTKLSIFTAAFAAEGSSFALTLGEPANSITIAITAGVATPATHIFFPVIVLFPF